MAINYTPVGWDTAKYVNPTNMNHMDDGIKAACDGVDAVNENLNDFVNIRMHTGGGFATMAEDIYAHWGEIKSETGGIRFSNGATVFSGIYYKFSETIGSMLLHQTGSNIVYIWKLYDNIPSLDTVALNSDFTTVTALTSEVGTVSGGYVKVGKVVTVSARIKLTQNVVNNSTKIFDGLPAPESSYLPLTTFNVDGGKNVDGYLVIQSSTLASLKIRTDNTDILSTGYSFMISGSYLSAH